MKAIVLTYDRNRPVTEHMIHKYNELWPDHPFVFRIPYQELAGTTTNSDYVKTPPEIRETVLQLIADLADEDWIYWCVDDKYPIQLVVGKISQLMTDAIGSPDMSGLLFCRGKALLRKPEVTLYPEERRSPLGDVYLERKGWHQIWIHQFLRVKVVRHLFSHMPKEIPSAKLMDQLKDDIPRLPEHRLFVTKENFAVFGESTHKGTLNQNCYESIKKTEIKLPKWFRRPNGKYVIIGEL